MRTTRIISVAIAGLLLTVPALALGATSVAAGQDTRGVPANPDSVLAWNVIAVNSALASGNFQVESLIRLSYVQAAVYDAVVAIDREYDPYVGHLHGPRGSSVDAAVATAAHAVLVVRYPKQQAGLDASYTAALAAIPDDPRKAAGIRVGAKAASGLLEAREGDGLDANVSYTFGAGPGVWVLPTDNTAPNFQTPQTPWVAQMRPFLIDHAAQFLPPPPPDLSSAAWAAEFNEVKAYGSKTSAVRTPEETQIATFWSAYAPGTYNAAMRTVATLHGFDAATTARALAMGNMVPADSEIACFNAKYHYSFWRPYTAIRGAAADGNPATTPDPTWLPLLATPNHPEYPAAHSCGTSALARVFAAVLGTSRINVDIYSTATHTTRHYTTVTDLDTEIVNARVWAGLHYHGSGLAGTQLATNVAQEALENHFEKSL